MSLTQTLLSTKQRLRSSLALTAAAACLHASLFLAPVVQAQSTNQSGSEPVQYKQLTPKLAPTDGNAAGTPVSSPGGAPSPAANSPGATAKPTHADGNASASATSSKTPANGSTSHTAGSTTKSSKMPPAAPSLEKFPKVAELEKIMFGVSQPAIPVDYRLDRLESEVFHHTNPEWDSKTRVQHLADTLVGEGSGSQSTSAGAPQTGAARNSLPPNAVAPNPADANGMGQPYGASAPYGNGNTPYGSAPSMPVYRGDPMQPFGAQGGMPYGGNEMPPTVQAPGYLAPPPGDLNSADFQREIPLAELQQFALQIINDARVRQGQESIAWDDVAGKVALDLVKDNCKRNTVSHQDKDGNNPDVRYTKAGGSACLIESITSVKATSKPVLSKALVYSIINELTSHQDDRDALLSAHATQGAFSLGLSSGHDMVVACAEIVTKQGDVAAIPPEIKVGEKLDIKGIIKGPYKFNRITIAWEGLLPTSGEDVEQQDEALPYFPPLDYVAFAKRTEHDFQRGKQMLQIAGITLALAGSVFLPPVALAAPLIMAAGPAMSKPKAVSDIPIKGGVHVDGAGFWHKLAVSKDNKEGIYYITVWANTDSDPTPIAISRRAVVARGLSDRESANVSARESVKESKKNNAEVRVSKQNGHLVSVNEPKKADAEKNRENDESK